MGEEDYEAMRLLEVTQKNIIQEIKWAIEMIRKYSLEHEQSTLDWMDELNNLSVTF